MDPALHVYLLGHFQLQYEGQAVVTVNSARLQSLLAYLVLHRQAPLSRQQIAALFWPDTSEPQARTNLRNLLHQLRQALPCCDDFICSNAYTLEWLKEFPYTLDVESFERCLGTASGQAVQREMLEQAVKIYGGDLLPGCYDDWIGPERERLRLAFLSALEALVVMVEGGREYSTALNFARRLIQADPLHPGANRQLIRLHSLLGDRPAALKAYRDYARLLQTELDTEPDVETQDLYARLRQAGSVLSRPLAADANPLVGRKAEWRRIQSVWQAASAGVPQAIFITGEAGIGKTRLVEELAVWADRQGIATASAFCYPAEGSLPYAPVVSWLRGQPIHTLEKTWLAEIARLLPEVKTKNPGLPIPGPLHEAWQRQHLFEALARALLVKRQALILILEDIHWCDQDTLEWLHYLLRFDPKAPLAAGGNRSQR